LPWFDPEDLSRDTEPIPIPIIDFHVGMMPFRYMSTGKVHEKASVNMSLFHHPLKTVVIVRLGIAYQLTCLVSVPRLRVERLPMSRVASSKIASSCKVSTIPRNQGHVNLLENVVCGVDATMNVVIVLFSRG
jgi:hypothetical protein